MIRSSNKGLALLTKHELLGVWRRMDADGRYIQPPLLWNDFLK